MVDQVLHTVSKSNSLEELTLENAGLKSYVSLLVSPDRRLLLLNLIWPSPFLLLTLSPVRPPHPPPPTHTTTHSLLCSSSLLSHLISPFQPPLSSSPSCCLLDLSFPTHTLYTFVHLFTYKKIISAICLGAFFSFIC